MDRIPVGVIGCGYWGPNLIRNFSSCPLTEMVAVCDSIPERLDAVRRINSSVKGVTSLDELLTLPIKAVAIATPVSTHYPLAVRCLEAGMHVMVEKPLTATVAEAEALLELASQHKRVLMVDHTYLFNPAVRRIKELVDQGELGDLHYIDSVRVNLGLFQHDINVIWDLAPHDLSIVDYVLGYEPRSISAWGCAHANPGIENIAYVNVDYSDHMLANFHVNWLSPVKIRQMIFAGSRKSLIFNELNSTEPVKVYDKGIEVSDGFRWVIVPATCGAPISSRWKPCSRPSSTLPSACATTHCRSAMASWDCAWCATWRRLHGASVPRVVVWC